MPANQMICFVVLSHSLSLVTRHRQRLLDVINQPAIQLGNWKIQKHPHLTILRQFTAAF